ncbi:MAG TPA: hypothetical protein VN618_14410 [Solirubrobacteraceae bacterium]|nr:hypothetical protein [Solirubrobacteraceae bacterium]
MRIKRIALAMAVALMALGAFAAPTFAKEKLIFGEFEGSVTGQNMETTPGVVQVWKEDKELTVESMRLGPYKFGTINGKQEFNENEPCAKSPKITGSFKAEEGKVNKSETLPLDIAFKKCGASAKAIGIGGVKYVSFTLPVLLKQNHSSEIGPKIAEVEIPNKTEIKFKGALSKCAVVIPQQTIPPKEKEEHEYEEVVSYNEEPPEKIEGWEHSKKLKELFPSGLKNRLEVEFEEKFKGIVTYVNANPPCFPAKGEDNPNLIEEGPEGPNGGKYNGWLEYHSGHIFMDIEGLEIKNGELNFVG